MAFNKKEVFRENLEALKLSFDIQRNRTRPETATQQIEILNRYRSFGGIKEVLLNNDPAQWNPSSIHLFELRQDLERLCLQMDEHSKVQLGTHYGDIKTGVLSAFFTPAPITDSISEAISKSFSPRLIIEPSAGAGAFIDSLTTTDTIASDTQIYAVEKDRITANLLKAKYHLNGLFSNVGNGSRAVNIYQGGFEDHSNSLAFFKKRFDASVSNIPFGDYKVFDEKYAREKRPVVKNSTSRIHNYYFVKNLDLLRDGGIMAFIVTSSFLNSPQNESIRKYVLSKSDIVSITRFPNMLFTAHAGTAVASDLIVLQKNDNKHSLGQLDEKLATSDYDEKFGNVNRYFNFYKDNDSYIATGINFDTDMYGKPAAILDFDGSVEDIAFLLSNKLENDFTRFKQQKTDISLDIFTALTGSAIAEVPRAQAQAVGVQFDLFAPNPLLETDEHRAVAWTGTTLPFYAEGTMVVQDDKAGTLADNNNGGFDFVPISAKINIAQAKAYLTLRDSFITLYNSEKKSLKEDAPARKYAQLSYNEYYSQFGLVNERRGRALVNFDGLAPQSYAIEKRTINDKKEFVFVPSDLLRHPVAFSTQEQKPLSPLNALFLNINTKETIDIDFILKNTDIASKEELLKSLDSHLFYLGQNKYSYKDDFLSGNIVEKLDHYDRNFTRTELTDKSSPHYAPYQALLSVKPVDIPFDDLDFNLGERWLPTRYYETFATELFQTDIRIVYIQSADTFKVTGSTYSNSIVREVYGVETASQHFNGIELLEYGMVSNSPQLTKTIGTNPDGSPIKGPDHHGMQAVSMKIEEISKKFEEYMSALPLADKRHIQELYNRKFNCFSTHKENGEHLEFNGLEHFEPNGHQKDAAWKLLLNGGGICDHPVGAGKSLVMALQAQKLREIGLAKKPMIACLKANAADVAKDYMKAFPKANILFPGEGDFSLQNRRSFLNMIKNNDWDCIIVTHEQFSAIPQPLDIQQKLLDREIAQLEEDIDQVRIEGGKVSNAMLKGLIKRKENLSVKLRSVLATIKKDDDIPDFRQLGIDHLAVDESHEFKNLGFTTRHGRVAGLGNQLGSNRAFNMLVASYTLHDIHGADKGLSFYSGTTISNSLTELYNLFKYIAPTTLEKQNIYNFDSWASVFTKKSTEYEMSVANELTMKERFRTFIKVPELCAAYGRITHFISQKNLQIERPDHVVKLINIPLTDDQAEFSERLIQFASTGDGTLIHRNELSESEKTAKMLIATNTARNMAVDMRLISDVYADDPGNKLSVCAKNISKWYALGNPYKATQLVFCDIGTPGKNDRFNVYAELKRKLVADYNIPEKEIAFVHSAKTDAQRQALFDKVSRGEVRVFIGSTKKMGTGVNVQQRVVAMHDLNVPWTPKDMEQRHGRGHRQGNEIARKFFDNKVHTFVYAMERSLDAYGFNLLKNKQLFIDQVKNNTLSVRTVDEGAMDESTGLPFKEYVAVLSGNTDLLEKLKLEKKIMGLEAEKKSFFSNQHDIEWKLKNMKEQVVRTEKIYRSLKDDAQHYFSVLKKDPKTEVKLNPITINGKSFENAQDAGNAILKYSGMDINGPVKIGELYGFGLFVKPDTALLDKGNLFYAKRDFVEYSYSAGCPNDNPALAARYFINSIDKCTGLYKDYEKKLESEFTNINLLESQKGRLWEKSGLLQKLKAEASLLENRIISKIQEKDQGAGQVLKEQKNHREETFSRKETVNLNFDNLNKKNAPKI